MNRAQRKRLAEDTVAVIERGAYPHPDRAGEQVSLREAIERAVAGTVAYPPAQEVDAPAPGDHATRVTVENIGALEAARALLDDGHARVCVLNFASAYYPGGGFLRGSQAQEEALVRVSALYACLLAQPDYYEHHNRLQDPLHTDYAIYSPDVPVFRESRGALLATPWPCSFVTCPAVQAKKTREAGAARGDDDATTDATINAAMERRIARVLAIMAAHGHAAIVLGAWGCGVFGNEPAAIAERFAALLRGPFAGVFATVRFAVLDRDPGPTITPFRRALQP